MTRSTVDLSQKDRGVLFDANEEARAAGWGTADPYVHLQKLYDGPPVLKGALEDLMGIPRQYPTDLRPGEVYSILSFDAVNKAFMDRETFSNRVYEKLSKPAMGDTLLNLDGGEHKRLRDVSKPWFKPSFTDGWWTDKWIVDAVDEIFDSLTAKEHADLNLELCAPLPMSVVSTGFGIPAAEALEFRQALLMHGTPEEMAKGHAHAAAVLTRLMDERLAVPGDDLISRFVHADIEQEDGTTRKLSPAEVMRYCFLIIHAGGGTTWRQMGITIMALLNHPEQMAALRQDRGLMRQTIQEVTRWYPTDTAFLRYVEKDTVHEGGFDRDAVPWFGQSRSQAVGRPRYVQHPSCGQTPLRLWCRCSCLPWPAPVAPGNGSGARRAARSSGRSALGSRFSARKNGWRHPYRTRARRAACALYTLAQTITVRPCGKPAAGTTRLNPRNR